MRLLLNIQRHELPPTKILWNISSTPAPEGAGLTISQFLEHLNDVIPLEANEWGLEDYALEVRGFECLHFTELHHVLKEDDEVSYVQSKILILEYPSGSEIF